MLPERKRSNGKEAEKERKKKTRESE